MRGLVSVQALASLNTYLGGNAEISRQTLTEFLHNMSHQVLNKDNDNVFIHFDRMAELIIELISVLLGRINKSLNIAKIINNNTNDEINDYRFTFDILTEIKKNKTWKKYKKNTNTASSLCPTTNINKERDRD